MCLHNKKRTIPAKITSLITPTNDNKNHKNYNNNSNNNSNKGNKKKKYISEIYLLFKREHIDILSLLVMEIELAEQIQNKRLLYLYN